MAEARVEAIGNIAGTRCKASVRRASCKTSCRASCRTSYRTSYGGSTRSFTRSSAYRGSARSSARRSARRSTRRSARSFTRSSAYEGFARSSVYGGSARALVKRGSILILQTILAVSLIRKAVADYYNPITYVMLTNINKVYIKFKIIKTIKIILLYMLSNLIVST